MTFISSGIEVGTLLTTLTAPTISITFGWEWVFYLFGALGILWSIIFALFARDEPQAEQQHVEIEQVSIVQLATPKPSIPYMRMLLSPAVWAIVVAHTR